MFGFGAVLLDNVIALVGSMVVGYGVPVHSFVAATGPAHRPDLVNYPLQLVFGGPVPLDVGRVSFGGWAKTVSRAERDNFVALLSMVAHSSSNLSI